MTKITVVILVIHEISPCAINMVHLKYIFFIQDSCCWPLFLSGRICAVCIMI